MRNLKRVFSLALALVMVLGMMVITTSAATYTDAEEITYTEAVDVMSALGILQGYNGAFNPKGTLTREGAAKILAFVTMGAEADNYLTGSVAAFDDVAADRWSAKYVAYCANLGIINGNGDGTFNPEGNISVVGFAKLLLGAIEVEGTYTGAGWEENVKKAVASVPTMAATGIKMTTADITREEACELALAAMQHGEKYSLGYYIEEDESLGYSESYVDAYVLAKACGIATPTITKHEDKKGTLLETVYEVKGVRDEDAFGRPGTLYYGTTKATKDFELFFQDAPVKTYTGTVTGGQLFADFGSAKITPAVADVYLDGYDCVNTTAENINKTIVKDNKVELQSVKGTLLTGNSVTTEVYATATEDVYLLVIVNVYADTVKEVVEADEKKDIKASIELTGGLKYETAEFAKGDAVLYTAANGVIKTIVKNETLVAGTPTKQANGVWTIGEATYGIANKGSVSIALGTKGEWYVDSFGNLIANKGAAKPAEKEYTFAVILEAAGVDYVKATEGSLVEAGKDAKDAKEVIKVKTAADEVLTLDTAWEYELDKDGKWVSTTFVNGGATPTYGKGTLVKYHVNKDGKVDEIIPASATPAAGEFTKGKATIKVDATTNWSGILADDTAIFLTDGKKVEVYTGFANVPSKAFTGATYFGGNGEADKAFDALLVTVASVEADTKGDDVYVFVADAACTEEWDASANKGEGAVVYVYEGLYVDGVKTTMTFKTEQSLKKGEMYAYNTKAETITATNLLTGSAKVTSIQSAYFLAGDVVYTGEGTAYVQVDAAKGTIADATGLPSIKDYTVTVLKVDSKDGVATTVFFSAVEIEK